MNAAVTITKSKDGKFIAVISIKNKFFLDGDGILTSKPFASKKVCIRNTEDICQSFGLTISIVETDDKKGDSINGSSKSKKR